MINPITLCVHCTYNLFEKHGHFRSQWLKCFSPNDCRLCTNKINVLYDLCTDDEEEDDDDEDLISSHDGDDNEENNYKNDEDDNIISVDYDDHTLVPNNNTSTSINEGNNNKEVNNPWVQAKIINDIQNPIIHHMYMRLRPSNEDVYSITDI